MPTNQDQAPPIDLAFDNIKNIMAQPRTHVMLPRVVELSQAEYFEQAIDQAATAVYTKLKQMTVHAKAKAGFKLALRGFEEAKKVYLCVELRARLFKNVPADELPIIAPPSNPIASRGLPKVKDVINGIGGDQIKKLASTYEVIAEQIRIAHETGAQFFAPTSVLISDAFIVINTQHLIQVTIGTIFETGVKLPDCLADEYLKMITPAAAVAGDKITGKI